MAKRGSAFSVIALGLGGLFPACGAIAHHAANVYFDVSRVIEIRGVITEVKWQNPHIGFSLRGRTAGGEEILWEIESNSVSTLSRLGITADHLQVGDVVTVAGWPPKQAGNRMSGNHVLLPDGREIVLRGSGTRHFLEGSDQRISVADVEGLDTGDATALGLFRVWSTITGDPTQDRLWEASYPLTEAARSAQATWDPLRDNPAIDCEPKGMPGIINPPYPMEFIDQGAVILQHQEEFDSVRTIYMDPEAAPSDPQPSLLGHSVGRWAGGTLVVETTHVNWPYFDSRGVPQSEQARFEERFTVSVNGKRLNYTLEVEDPQTFTEPVRLDRFWLWIPGRQVRPYNCTPL